MRYSSTWRRKSRALSADPENSGGGLSFTSLSPAMLSELESELELDGEGASGSKADLYSISGVLVRWREVSALGVVAKCGDSSRVNLQ